jgi:hypothetical protein
MAENKGGAYRIDEDGNTVADGVATQPADGLPKLDSQAVAVKTAKEKTPPAKPTASKKGK